MKSPQAPLWKRLHWINLFFLTGTPIAALILLPLYLYYHGFGWRYFSLFLIYSAATGMSITAGYHRLLAHRSYDAKPFLKLVYLLIGAAAFQGSALQWCTDHRRHHRFVDTEDDPHNIKKGFFHAHVGWLFLKEDPKYANSQPPDLMNDPMVAWQDRHYVLLAILMGGGFPTLIGWAMGNAWGGFVFGGLLRVIFTNHVTFCINSLAHTLGTRPYSASQTARDSIIMAILAYGEGYHNYHHAFAADYRNGIRWYHWDPTKWLIRLLSFFGVTYGLKEMPSAAILRARLQTDTERMREKGIPVETLTPFKQRVEEAQRRMRQVREEYQRLKKSMQSQSRRRVEQIRFEYKIARRDFKLALAQWGALRRQAPARVRVIR